MEILDFNVGMGIWLLDGYVIDVSQAQKSYQE